MRSISILLAVLLFASFSANATGINKQVNCMAEAIYYESKSEPVAGKMAVATVIKERAAHPAYPSTVCKVVNQRNPRGCQFSWVCNGARKMRKNAQQWEESLEIAQKALLFEESHPIIDRKDGLFFHAKYVNPSWARTKRVIARIGNHIFYSEKPNAGNKRTNRVPHAVKDQSQSATNAAASTNGYVISRTGSDDPQQLRLVASEPPADATMAP